MAPAQNSGDSNGATFRSDRVLPPAVAARVRHIVDKGRLVTQMSADRPRSTRKLRSRSAFCSGYRDIASTPVSHTLTTFSTRSPSRTGNDHDVQPRVCPAVTCAVSAIGPTPTVSPSLNRLGPVMRKAATSLAPT
jgi:hypothetical protein